MATWDVFSYENKVRILRLKSDFDFNLRGESREVPYRLLWWEFWTASIISV